jgi:hypothetical protein
MGLYRRQQFSVFIRRLFVYLPSSFVLNDREAFTAFAARAWDYLSARISLYWLSGWIIAGLFMLTTATGVFGIFTGLFVIVMAIYFWTKTDVIR